MAKATKTVQQPNFKFELGDQVIIMFPNEKNESLKGTRGKIVYRGYTDCYYTDENGDPIVYPILYGIEDQKNGLVPGMPESWLAKNITIDFLEDV